MATLPHTITLYFGFLLHCSFVHFFIPCGLFIYLFTYLFVYFYLFIYCAVTCSEYRA